MESNKRIPASAWTSGALLGWFMLVCIFAGTNSYAGFAAALLLFPTLFATSMALGGRFLKGPK